MLNLRQPIAQDPEYYRFADARSWLGVPNAWNVWSNLPFVIVGVVGLVWLARHAVPQRKMWVVFFLGVFLTGFGSAYFHLAPCDATLVWDRLPMAISFMAFFVALLAERVSERAGNWLFVPLLAVGLGSVMYWRVTGDLRLYGLVQFGPMLVIPILLVLRPGRWLRTRDVVVVLVWYVAAKILERLDQQMFALGRVVSGHALKHLAAAVAPGWVWLALRKSCRSVTLAGNE